MNKTASKEAGGNFDAGLNWRSSGTLRSEAQLPEQLPSIIFRRFCPFVIPRQ